MEDYTQPKIVRPNTIGTRPRIVGLSGLLRCTFCTMIAPEGVCAQAHSRSLGIIDRGAGVEKAYLVWAEVSCQRAI